MWLWYYFLNFSLFSWAQTPPFHGHGSRYWGGCSVLSEPRLANMRLLLLFCRKPIHLFFLIRWCIVHTHYHVTQPICSLSLNRIVLTYKDPFSPYSYYTYNQLSQHPCLGRAPCILAAVSHKVDLYLLTSLCSFLKSPDYCNTPVPLDIPEHLCACNIIAL